MADYTISKNDEIDFHFNSFCKYFAIGCAIIICGQQVVYQWNKDHQKATVSHERTRASLLEVR
jgi:hypothetical protein